MPFCTVALEISAVKDKVKGLKLDMTGSLEANSAKSIYLDSVHRSAPLTIQAISAGENIGLVSDYAPIVMSAETGKDTGRLTGKKINIDAARNNGVVGNGLRITNNGANVSLRTYYGDIFVQGIGSGSLNLRSLSTYGKFGFITDGTASGLAQHDTNLKRSEKITTDCNSSQPIFVKIRLSITRRIFFAGSLCQRRNT